MDGISGIPYVPWPVALAEHGGHGEADLMANCPFQHLESTEDYPPARTPRDDVGVRIVYPVPARCEGGIEPAGQVGDGEVAAFLRFEQAGLEVRHRPGSLRSPPSAGARGACPR